VAAPLEVTLTCPITKLAVMPLVNGGMNSSTRPLSESVTQRLPLASKAM
jgi:hypothetical protein